MKLNHTLTFVALALAGVSASATTVTNWGTLGPAGEEAHVVTEAPGPTAIDDIYTFDFGATSDVSTYAKEFEAYSVSMSGAEFTLYQGNYGSAAGMIGTPMAFGGDTPTTATYTSLASGDYYFEVTGTAEGSLGSDYNFVAFANDSAPPLTAVPEPANMALMLAGMGLLGFLGKRRKQR